MSSELWFPLASHLPPGRLVGAVLSPGSARGLRPGLSLGSCLASHRSGRVGSRAVSSAPGNLWVVGSEEPALFTGAGGWGAEPARTVALEHVIVQTRERPREESSGREAFHEWGFCLRVPSFLSVPCLYPECAGGCDAVCSSPFRDEESRAARSSSWGGWQVGSCAVPAGLLRSQTPCRVHCTWKPRSVTGSICAHVARPCHIPSGMPAVTSATCPCSSFSTVTLSGGSQVCFPTRAHVLLRCDGLDEAPGQSRGRSVCHIHCGQQSPRSIRSPGLQLEAHRLPLVGQGRRRLGKGRSFWVWKEVCLLLEITEKWVLCPGVLSRVSLVWNGPRL